MSPGTAISQVSSAYRLAWQADEGLVTSTYAYFCPEAAENAAPVLNRTRFARGKQRYTHLVEFAEQRPVRVRELEVAA